MWHERFAVIFANVAVRGKARLGAQVTGELAAEILLHDDDALALEEDAGNFLAVEWHNPLDRELICDQAFFARQFLHRFANDSLSRAPAHERDLGVWRADELRRRDLLKHGAEFAAALFHHFLALVWVSKLIA